MISSARRRSLSCLCLGLLALLVTGIAAPAAAPREGAASAGPRERVSFNAGWRFQKDDPAGSEGQLAYKNLRAWLVATGGDLSRASAARPARPEGNPGAGIAYVQPPFDDSAWRGLDLPHDWGIEGPFKQEYPGDTGKLPWWGVGWYRKHFTVPAGEADRHFFLDVDGAMAYAAVWLNGRWVGGWPYGYSSFRLDMTAQVKPGADNVIAIRLDNPPESSRWYPGGGIYRNVWLVKTGAVRLAHWGTFVTTPVIAAESATVNVDFVLETDATAKVKAMVTARIYEIDPSGARGAKPVAESDPVAVEIDPAKAREAARSNLVTVPRPRLWSLEQPCRYAAVISVESEGRFLDEETVPFGIRSIAFDANRGFLLNGKVTPINGVCDHHDLGALGTAVNRRALERQVRLLKEMGCNAIRTSHNPPAPEFLDICDEQGMLVMDEAFDCWRIGKKANDYQLLFDDWHEKDLRALVRRDRNHPCVILWSIGNEVREQWVSDGWRMAADLAGIVREEDRTRFVTSACNSVDAGYNGFQGALDVMGFNYKPWEYATFRKQHPTIPVMGNETASCVSSRAEYFFPVVNDKAGCRADFQVSSYDLYAPRWALPPDVEFAGIDDVPGTAGEFVWTGFDYLGEPTPFNNDSTNLLNFSDPAEQQRMAKELKELGRIRVPSRSSYFGIIDLAGFKKDRFFIYQARWRPDLPMAHLLPHWTWPERTGQVTPVFVYTSGDEAELFLDGKSLGRKHRGPRDYRLRWDDIRYEPGELRVVAYRQGKPWAEDVARTAGPAAKVSLAADRVELRADGDDLAFVTVSIADRNDVLAPRAKNLVRFEIEGPGTIVAVDNGDATSFAPFQEKERQAYNGLALVIVRTKRGTPGRIVLKAVSDGLDTAEVVLQSVAG